ERLGDADMLGRGELAHQPDRERRGDESTTTKTHDRHASRHPGSVGEPFDQGRDRRDVADAKPAAAEYAIAEVDEPQIMRVDAERGQQEAACPAKARGKHSAAWPALLDPAAEHRRRGA